MKLRILAIFQIFIFELWFKSATRIRSRNWSGISNPLNLIHNLTLKLKWYEAHYAKALGRKKNAKLTEEEQKTINGPRSNSAQKKIDERRKQAEVAASLVEQFGQGRLLARIASRPGQTGRCDGYILEGKELDFYVRKLKAKKTK